MPLPAAAIAQQSVNHRGMVTSDQSGEPVPGSSVELRGTASTFRATTDSAGQYRIPAVPVGRYIRRVRRVGFLPGVDTISITTPDPFPIRLTPLVFAVGPVDVRACRVVAVTDLVPVAAADAVAQVEVALARIRELFETRAVSWAAGRTSREGQQPDTSREARLEVKTTPTAVAAMLEQPPTGAVDSVGTRRWVESPVAPMVEIQLARAEFPRGYCLSARSSGNGLRVDFVPDSLATGVPPAARQTGSFFLRGTVGRLDSLTYEAAHIAPAGMVRSARSRVTYQSVFVDGAELRLPLERSGAAQLVNGESRAWRLRYLAFEARRHSQ